MTSAGGIINLLVAANVGALAPSSDWPIYEGKFPDQVEQCLAVIPRGGKPPEVKVAINYPSVQVLVRGTKKGYADAAEKANEVFVALQAIDTPSTDYPELASCTAATDPIFVGYDSSERPVWSINFNLILSKDPEGYRDL